MSLTEWEKSEIDHVPYPFNWKDFWIACKKEFPLHSVAGSTYYNTPRRIKSKEYSLTKERYTGKTTPGHNVLEIGYGYGGSARYFHEAGMNYYGIDYKSSGRPNKKYGEFIEINKSGIPSNLRKKRFAIVYSTNVFQHMTRKQRIEYYNQVAKILEPGCEFRFDLFTRNPLANKDEFETEPYATNFFGVHTYVPTIDEVTTELHKAGFNQVSHTKEHELPGDRRTVITTFYAK